MSSIVSTDIANQREVGPLAVEVFGNLLPHGQDRAALAELAIAEVDQLLDMRRIAHQEPPSVVAPAVDAVPSYPDDS